MAKTLEQRIDALIAQVSDVEKASKYFSITIPRDASLYTPELLCQLEQVVEFEKMEDFSIYPEWEVGA